jgi:hypothetical protein
MNNQSYSATIEVVQPAGAVFNYIIEVPKWWTKDFDGDNKKLNDEFVICHPGQHYSKQQVIELVLGKKIVWLVTGSKMNWLEKDQEEWTNTKMIFELSTEGDKTLVRFTHHGLSPEKECYDRCSQGWDLVIKDFLFNFITAGKTL